MGSGPTCKSPFGLDDKAPEPPGCWILEDLQTLHIPTNKKVQVWTQYRLFLSLVATSLLSRKYYGKGRFRKNILKSGKILRNHSPVRLFWILEPTFIINCVYLLLLNVSKLSLTAHKSIKQFLVGCHVESDSRVIADGWVILADLWLPANDQRDLDIRVDSPAGNYKW